MNEYTTMIYSNARIRSENIDAVAKILFDHNEKNRDTPDYRLLPWDMSSWEWITEILTGRGFILSRNERGDVFFRGYVEDGNMDYESEVLASIAPFIDSDNDDELVIMEFLSEENVPFRYRFEDDTAIIETGRILWEFDENYAATDKNLTWLDNPDDQSDNKH